MTQEAVQVDITDDPRMREITDAVRQSGTPCVLTESGEAVAVVMPLAPLSMAPETRRPRRRTKGRFTRDDPLFGLIGIGASGHSDVSSNKHTYLAEAYSAKRR